MSMLKQQGSAQGHSQGAQGRAVELPPECHQRLRQGVGFDVSSIRLEGLFPEETPISLGFQSDEGLGIFSLLAPYPHVSV